MSPPELEAKLMINLIGLCIVWLIYSSLAQSVEHAAVNRRVVGSSPTGGAKIRLRGQAVKTPPFHGGNRGSIPLGVTKRKSKLSFTLSYIFFWWRIVMKKNDFMNNFDEKNIEQLKGSFSLNNENKTYTLIQNNSPCKITPSPEGMKKCVKSLLK